MKRIGLTTLLFLVGLAIPVMVFAQESTTDKITVPLTDPGRPVTLRVSLLNGSISVKGTPGKEVIVEATTRLEDSRSEDRQEKIGGLRRIPNTSSGLRVEEEDNVVEVGASHFGGSRTTDLHIQVPTNTSAKLSTINDGDILVENVNGELEIHNTNGHVTLTNVSGSAVAHALNGDLIATFIKVDQQKPMSFTSMNGKIDVTLPADIKATLQMKSEMGDIYSDFDLKLEKTSAKVEESGRGKKGKFLVTIEKGMRGTVNGGGMDIQFKNYNGDIYIRKGK